MHPPWTMHPVITNDAAKAGSPLLVTPLLTGILKSATATLGVVRLRPNWSTRNERLVVDVQFM